MIRWEGKQRVSRGGGKGIVRKSRGRAEEQRGSRGGEGEVRGR